jgi:hypothetical protein
MTKLNTLYLFETNLRGKKTSTVRRFDSLDPRLYQAEVFFACVNAARINLEALSEKAMQISFLKL